MGPGLFESQRKTTGRARPVDPEVVRILNEENDAQIDWAGRVDGAKGALPTPEGVKKKQTGKPSDIEDNTGDELH